MKDINGEIQYKNRVYKLAFNLNVMQAIQRQYGSIEAWGSLTDGTECAKRLYEAEKHDVSWEQLPEAEKAKYPAEPDVEAVIFGFTEMLNEGIEIDNDENGTDLKLMTTKQVGRMITEVGMSNALGKLQKTVVDSTQSTEKNE